jgi:hypothetical protein
MTKKREGENKFCLACGSHFYVPAYRIKTAKFCSLHCQQHKQYENKRVRFICEGCKNECVDSPSRIGKRKKWCSIECKSTNALKNVEIRQKSKAWVKLNRGINSSQILRKWIKKIKPMICQVCGYDKYDFNIDLHHIDENPNNNDLENIAILCCMCHRELHKGLINL